MKNVFYKINSKYIESFSKRVLTRFRNENIKTNATFLKVLFKELNSFFKYIGGQISSKDNIPKTTDYPDSNQFNKLIFDISDDLQKLYTTQKLIEDDVNNLLNFNSTQRSKTFENLTSIQQQINSIYIKNKKEINGEIILPNDNPFSSSDNKSDESFGIYINQTRKTLTLDYNSSVQKTSDLANVLIFFADTIPDNNVYPNKQNLGIGQHWKLLGPNSKSVHFIDSKNPSEVLKYKELMEDNNNNNLAIGWCEFESVKTNINKTTEESLKKYIGEKYQSDSQLIYLDVNNSLQGSYINQDEPKLNSSQLYKLVIPFKNNSPMTNEITIDFEPNSNGYYPKIIWSRSKVFSNQHGSDLEYKLIPPATDKIPENGSYSCMIQNFIKPSRLELFLEYGTDSLQWYPMAFCMSKYTYNAKNNYSLQNETSETIKLELEKTYDIFVDTEVNQENEKTRASNVLSLRGK